MDTGDIDSTYSILVTILVTGVLAVNNRQKRGKVSFLIKIKYYNETYILILESLCFIRKDIINLLLNIY